MAPGSRQIDQVFDPSAPGNTSAAPVVCLVVLPVNCDNHDPKVIVRHVHHVVPSSMGGKDVADNRARGCPNCHYDGHHLLNEYVRYWHGPDHLEKPPWEVRRRYSRNARFLAELAIERLGGISKLPRVFTAAVRGEAA